MQPIQFGVLLSRRGNPLQMALAFVRSLFLRQILRPPPRSSSMAISLLEHGGAFAMAVDALHAQPTIITAAAAPTLTPTNLVAAPTVTSPNFTMRAPPQLAPHRRPKLWQSTASGTRPLDCDFSPQNKKYQ
jgi:hypothetical protein